MVIHVHGLGSFSVYYKLGEWGGFKTREEDYKHWGITDDKSSSS